MQPTPQQYWSLSTFPLADGHTIAWTLVRDRQPVTFAEILEAWANDQSFRQIWIDALAANPYAAYRWETPPLTSATLDQPFQCVLVDRPSLRRPKPDRQTFFPYFSFASPFPGVVCFPNLGGDAQLVVPTPEAQDMVYPHLAVFSRSAPMWQQHALWQAVASLVLQMLEERTGDRPLWLNTAGGGVAWLHIRLDDRPKYYQHAPYRNAV